MTPDPSPVLLGLRKKGRGDQNDPWPIICVRSPIQYSVKVNFGLLAILLRSLRAVLYVGRMETLRRGGATSKYDSSPMLPEEPLHTVFSASPPPPHLL